MWVGRASADRMSSRGDAAPGFRQSRGGVTAIASQSRSARVQVAERSPHSWRRVASHRPMGRDAAVVASRSRGPHVALRSHRDRVAVSGDHDAAGVGSCRGARVVALQSAQHRGARSAHRVTGTPSPVTTHPGPALNLPHHRETVAGQSRRGTTGAASHHHRARDAAGERSPSGTRTSPPHRWSGHADVPGIRKNSPPVWCRSRRLEAGQRNPRHLTAPTCSCPYTTGHR
jgi:hypothetical protein